MSKPNQARLAPLSPTEVEDRIDPLAPEPDVPPGGTDLPYGQLGGRGFEDLCYALLIAEGHTPYFFGRSGQRDRGVDIVVDKDDASTVVYQCKNERQAPNWKKIRDAVAKFESEWLDGTAGLPTPKSFVYCCPWPLDDRHLGEEWTRFKEAFYQRTGVTIRFWDKHALDTRLRGLPDLVAGLFSDSYAEQFCGQDGWQDDPWTRVRRDRSRHLPVKQFLQQHKEGTIYVSEQEVQEFADALSEPSVLVIRGLPGAGKTTTGLELACRLPAPGRYIYYATMEDFENGGDVQPLWQWVRRRNQRKHLPALFVLDDCHLDLGKTKILTERLAPELGDNELGDTQRKTRLLLILRGLPGTGEGQEDDTPDWLRELIQDKRVLDLRTDPDRTRAVTECLRSELAGLSEQRLTRLHRQSGGDLVFLREILAGIDTPQDLDEWSPERLYKSLRTRYFERGDKPRPLRNIRRLACLAQFDLSPLVSYLDNDWQPGEEALAEPLMVRSFDTQQYQFLHSSLAELVAHALLPLEVPKARRVEEEVIKTTAKTLLEYLRHLVQDPDTAADLPWTLRTLLGSHLRLTDGERIKAEILGDAEVQATIEKRLEGYTFGFLHICLIVLPTDHPARPRYLEMVTRRFRLLFDRERPEADDLGMTTIGSGLLTLRWNAPDLLKDLLDEYGAGEFLRLIIAKGTLVELFRILQYATPDFREALLAQLRPDTAAELVDKTIAVGRSIGTLDLAMRELGNTDPDLLGRLEQWIGADQFLTLITAKGTLFELFRILQRATPDFREALLEQLQPDTAAELVAKTIAAGRSIGTLDLTMRELGTADPALLDRLEQLIGADRFLTLITANGTLFELFKILERATPDFQKALLAQLQPNTAAELVDKTIAAGRSIGTLPLAMRELRTTDPDLLGRLEQRIGAEQFLDLITHNGTLFELFQILQYATPDFREALLAQLQPDTAAELVDKTIAAGRSIGTLDLAMRELGNTDLDLLRGLEQWIGADQFLSLITANGTLVELFLILKQATPGFRGALLKRLQSNTAAELVDKTIAAGQSIESLHYTLRGLCQPTHHRRWIQNKMGIDGWWRLLSGVGTLHSLAELSGAMSGGFRRELVATSTGLDVPAWRGIIARGLFHNACNFVNQKLAGYPAAIQVTFQQALADSADSLAAEATWFDLNRSVVSPTSTSAASETLRAALQTRIETLEPDALLGLDFREAVNGLAFAWREQPELRPVLAMRLRDILPGAADWPREKGEVAALRLVLALARSQAIPTEDARRLLTDIRAFLDKEVCDGMRTFPLFLLLWNMAALHYERGGADAFEGTLPPPLIQVLMAVLGQRVSPKGANKEKLSQLALGGLLHFLVPRLARELRDMLAPLTRLRKWLQPEALESSFVPALFALEGLALARPARPIFTPQVCSDLLAKSEEYEDVGPAIEHLRRRIRRYGNLRCGERG